MRTLLFVFFLIFSASFFAEAQTVADSISLDRDNDKAFGIYLMSPDSAIGLSNITLAEAKKKHLRYAEAKSYYVLSKANWAKSNFRLSLEYGYKALRLTEHSGYKTLWFQSTLTLARNFIDIHELDQAQKLIDEALILANDPKNEELLFDVWREYSLLLIRRGLYDSAIRIADRGLEYCAKNNRKSNAGILYGRKASAYLALKDYPKSILFDRLSINTDKSANNNRLLCIDMYQLGENYFHTGMPDSALYYLKISDSLAVYIKNFPRSIMCREMMAAVLDKQHKTAAALVEFKNIIRMKDSLHQWEAQRLSQESSRLNEIENKDREIKLLETENNVSLQKVTIHRWVSGFLIAGIVLLVVIILLLTRLRKTQNVTNQILSDKNAAIEQQREEISTQAENLQQLNQLKVKLFSVISHDLRGPITNLKVLLDMLTQKVMTPEEFLELSGKLKVDVGVNQRTLENLLAWSMSQMEGIKTEPRNIELNVLVEEVCRLMREMASRKGIVLKGEMTGNYTVNADYDQVQLILRNIIHNAIKFSYNNSNIVISVTAIDSFCRISVRDSGVGMSEDEIEILSNNHEHYTTAGTQKEKGTGLGWLLCKEFIARNGGTFAIASTPGEGTAISFTLPLN